MGKQMLLSEEFQVGRINAREEAVRAKEIEMARAVREEKARRRAVRRTARSARTVRTSGEPIAEAAPRAGSAESAEHGTRNEAGAQIERRELLNAGR